MRVNARLDTICGQKVKYLAHETHDNVTEILKKAIDFYYQQVKTESAFKAATIRESGFVGSAKLSNDSSTNYKADLFRPYKKA